MKRIELSFESKHKSLSVRRFSIREAMSAPFVIDLFARSSLPDIEIEPFLNKTATLTLRSGVVHLLHDERTYEGVVIHMEQTRVEKPQDGSEPLSTYHVRIAPTLWLLQKRTRSRIFHRKSIITIVEDVLSDWGITPKKQIAKDHPVRDYVVQYEETDFAFVSRLLELEGVTYYFAFDGGKKGELTLHDHPEDIAERPKVSYADNPSQSSEKEFVTMVRLAHHVRPGSATVRDFDLRRRLDKPVLGEAKPAAAPEDFYEGYYYRPGSSLIVDGADSDASTPFADKQRGKVRSVDKVAKAIADVWLVASRRDKRRVAFHTNCVDFAPGVTFAIDGHPRSDLAKPILITDMTFDGGPNDEWVLEGEATFTASPYAPEQHTPAPKIFGVLSATVVGPAGEEIHTDELGRVCVRFPWDRGPEVNEQCSCWVRASQGWAGRGFGTMMIPRVGQEVLVAFYEGDPSLPVIVGRAYNTVEPLPGELATPKHMTRSAWRTDTSPHADDSYNEIRFEDEKDKEYVFLRAQRDLQKLVKHHETERTGQNRAALVGKDRRAIVAEVDATLAGVKYSLQMMDKPSPSDLKILELGKPTVSPQPTKIELVDDKVLVTSGSAVMTLEGGDAVFGAKGELSIEAGGSVIVEGGSDIKINC